MTGLPTLTTERLCLRPFVAADGPEVERLAGVWEVAETTLHIPHPYPPGIGAGWISLHAGEWATGAGLTLAITPRERSAELLGAVGLTIDREHRRAEIGYWVAAPAWGKGYATEAARAMAAFAFESLGLHRVEARHFTRNPASGRVMQKIGMQLEGVHRAAYVRWERYEDVAVYGMLASEWNAAR